MEMDHLEAVEERSLLGIDFEGLGPPEAAHRVDLVGLDRGGLLAAGIVRLQVVH